MTYTEAEEYNELFSHDGGSHGYTFDSGIVECSQLDDLEKHLRLQVFFLTIAVIFQ